MYQSVQIIGNLGGDPELRYTPTGLAVCNFSVAVNRTSGKGEARKQVTTWFKCSAWKETAESCAQYLHKGSLVMVVGTVTASAYTAKDGKSAASLDLTADRVQFLDKKEQGETENERAEMPF